MTDLLETLKKRYASVILSQHQFRDEWTVVVDKKHVHDLLEKWRNEPGIQLDLLVDITAVDWPEREPRFDVVYHLYSLRRRHRLRVKVGIAERESIRTVRDLWRGADWLERETWDMFGIRFEGHTDLRRLLLYDTFNGHPLRKDYPLQGEQPRISYRMEPDNRWKDPDRWKDPTS